MYPHILELIAVLYFSTSIIACVGLIRDEQFSFSVWASWLLFAIWLLFSPLILAGSAVWCLTLGNWPIDPPLEVFPRRHGKT